MTHELRMRIRERVDLAFQPSCLCGSWEGTPEQSPEDADAAWRDHLLREGLLPRDSEWTRLPLDYELQVDVHGFAHPLPPATPEA